MSGSQFVDADGFPVIKDSPEQRAYLTVVLENVLQAIDGLDNVRSSVGPDGLAFRWTATHYCRGCNVGTTEEEGSLTWEEILSGADLEARLSRSAEERNRVLEAQQREREEAERQRHRERHAQMEREEYLRLQAIYGPGQGGRP